MARKKEAKELIEVLLREQRLRRPPGPDPLEGIEWEGLPAHLRGRVYQPRAKDEPLAELISSVRTEALRPVPAVHEEPRPSAGQPAIPPRPTWWRRHVDWFSDVFAFAGKTCEVRAATLIVLSLGAVFVCCLAFLYGFERGRDEGPPIRYNEYAVEPTRLPHTGQQGAERRPPVVASGGAAPAAPPPAVGSAPPPKAAPLAAERRWAIRIQTVADTPNNLRLSENLCRRLIEAGVPDARVVAIGGRSREIVIVAGGWPDQKRAEAELAQLRPRIEGLRGVEGFPSLRGAMAWELP